jgi:predicted amidophosphoribosyltransferase
MEAHQSQGLGSGGHCLCPKCGERIAHRRGVPCQDEHCPRCGAKLLREGSEHHRLFLAKREREKETRGSG